LYYLSLTGIGAGIGLFISILYLICKRRNENKIYARQRTEEERTEQLRKLFEQQQKEEIEQRAFDQWEKKEESEINDLFK
jgi:hypothetical protein